MNLGETNYALRYWRSLVRPNEMRINVEVTYADTGAYAVHTQRFFDKIDVDTQYAVAAVPRVPSSWPQLALWSHQVAPPLSACALTVSSCSDCLLAL